jgi:hypothetical protein
MKPKGAGEDLVRKIVVKVQDAHLPASEPVPTAVLAATGSKEISRIALNP